MSSHAELKKARTVTLPGAYARVQRLPFGSCREIAGARFPASWLSPMNAFRDALTGGALGGAGAGGAVMLVPAKVVGGVAISALTTALPRKCSVRTPPTARTANPAMIQWMNFRGTGTDPARSAAPRSIGALPVANAVARSSGERCVRGWAIGPSVGGAVVVLSGGSLVTASPSWWSGQLPSGAETQATGLRTPHGPPGRSSRGSR